MVAGGRQPWLRRDSDEGNGLVRPTGKRHRLFIGNCEVEALPARTEDPNLQITSCSLRLENDYESMNFREDGSIDWEACRDDCALSCVYNFELVDDVASHRCGYEENEGSEEQRQSDQIMLDTVGIGEEDEEEERKSDQISEEENINQSSLDAIFEYWETAVVFICCCGSKTEPVSQMASAP